MTVVGRQPYDVVVSLRFPCSLGAVEMRNPGYYAVDLNISMAYYADDASMTLAWTLPALTGVIRIWVRE